jgi:hypothetical protein
MRRSPKVQFNIWHYPIVDLYCIGDEGFHEVDSLEGSIFPTHRVWLNGARKAEKPQGPLSDLWLSDPDRPSFAAGDASGVHIGELIGGIF